MRVLPDVAAIDKVFDYVVPEEWETDGRAERVVVGSVVRIELHGRRVGGWVLESDVEPTPGVDLRPLAKLSGYGPSAAVVALGEWVAHRWAGRLARVLVSASPPHVVRSLPAPRPPVAAAESFGAGLAKAFDKDRSVVRLPPTADPFPVVQEAARLGNALIVAPTVADARVVGARLRRAGGPVAVVPRDWELALAGSTVVGARSAVLAPVVDLAAVVVLDEHDEAHQEERNPTWHARDVALERAARAGVPCVLVSPVPSLAAIEAAPVLRPSRTVERQGWPVLEIIDRHDDDPVRGGLLSSELTAVLRGDGPVVCVLNRKGRSRRLACGRCGELAWHEPCSVAFQQDDVGRLLCPSCGEERPQVCERCGSTQFKNLRAGVSRVREELEALARRPVQEITGDNEESVRDSVIVGTEAVLHRVPTARSVVFLDFDQELLARRYRAAEQAMGLLARAARLVGDRDGGGRLVVQTRVPDHEVLQAVRHADPGRLVEPERTRRNVLRFPPFVAMAELSGAGAADFAGTLRGFDDVEVVGPLDDRFLVKATSPDVLADVLEAAPRPDGRLRVAVDPPRV
ncbi:MAG: hypothetical protein ACR2QE_05990 [Acidimicrobiales bacterium]